MSAHLSISLSGPSQPRADVLRLDATSATPGEQFIVLHFDADCRVILSGMDREAAASARAVAAVLMDAAEAIEARVAPVRPMETYEELDARIAGEMAREEA